MASTTVVPLVSYPASFVMSISPFYYTKNNIKVSITLSSSTFKILQDGCAIDNKKRAAQDYAICGASP